MIAKTKKYELEPTKYVAYAMGNILKSQWWYIIGPAIVIALGFVFPKFMWAFIITGALIPVLYLLFWLIQFAGATKVEQNKMMFEKLSYEIDSKQIMIKVKANMGMPMKWEMIQRAEKGTDHFLLVVSKAQIIYLPFNIFNSDNDVKFVESILKRKELIKS